MDYIAEIGANWRTSDDLDKCWTDLVELIRDLSYTDVTFVKFQAWDTPKFIHKNHPDYKQFEKYELPKEWYPKLIDLCEEWDVKFMTTPFDKDTADRLHKLGQCYWKIASGDVTNLDLISHIAKYSQEMYLSTGNANDYEIKKAVDTIRKYNNAPLTILHCISKYPTELNEIGLRRLITLDEQYPYCDLGWSNHVNPEDSIIVGAAVKAFGVDIIETHVKPAGVDTPDSSFAMTVDQLSKFMYKLKSLDMTDPVVDEHELLWARRGEDGLRPWINWEIRDGKNE